MLKKESLLIVFFFFFSFRVGGNRAYELTIESEKVPVYCHKTNDLGECVDGGWTLDMKMNGSKVWKSLRHCYIIKTKLLRCSLFIFYFSIFKQFVPAL